MMTMTEPITLPLAHARGVIIPSQSVVLRSIIITPQLFTGYTLSEYEYLNSRNQYFTVT